MSPESWENDLRMEAEGLTQIMLLLQASDEMLAGFLSEYGEYLDNNLVTLLEMYRYDVNITLNGVVPLDDKEVHGIVKQLDDVMDEIQTLQAGLPTKRGVPDEDVSE